MRLIEALSVLQKINPSDPVFSVALVCGFTPQPFRTFLAAHLQLLLPGQRIEISEGRFGDLSGNLDRYLREPSGAAAIVLDWADLDSRLGWRQHGGWGRSQVDDICGVVERQLNIIEEMLAQAAGAGLLAVSLPTTL